MSLEYAGTEGHSGSEASEERAHREAGGAASERQQRILDFLDGQGEYGATWQEVGGSLGLHHGQATGSLSNLHKAGLIARLTTKRARCSIYVLPSEVHGRQTVSQGRPTAETSPVGFPYRHGPHLFLGPDVTATIDGEYIVWKGRKYHPMDSHNPTAHADATDHGRRPLFDIDQ